MGNGFAYISLLEMIQPVFWCMLMESVRGCLRWSEAGRNVVAVKAGEGGERTGSGQPWEEARRHHGERTDSGGGQTDQT